MAFLRCLGKICNVCHKISYIGFFVVYPTLPLSARGFPAHQQPTKWFSSYISCDNLTSCNGFTRHWYPAVPASYKDTYCAARNKCLCNSPDFFWASARLWSETQACRCKASALAVLSAGSHSSMRKHKDIHTTWEGEHDL